MLKSKLSQISIVMGLLALISCSSNKKATMHIINRSPESIYEPVDSAKIPPNKSENDYKIEKSIVADMRRKLSSRSFENVYVQVQDGIVKFTGHVRSNNELIKCMDIAWSKQGVKEVDNYIEIKNEDHGFDVTQYTKDAWITASVKAKLALNKNIRSRNFTVTTDQNIVYIFGISDSQYEIQETGSIAAAIKGVNKVIVNVTLIK